VRAGPMTTFEGDADHALAANSSIELLIWRFDFLEMGVLNHFIVVDSLSKRPRGCFGKMRETRDNLHSPIYRDISYVI
jgi:hypothetical protein